MNAEYLSPVAFDLSGLLLIQTVQGDVVIRFLGLHKTRIDGLIIGEKPANEAFTAFGQGEELMEFVLERGGQCRFKHLADGEAGAKRESCGT